MSMFSCRLCKTISHSHFFIKCIIFLLFVAFVIMFAPKLNAMITAFYSYSFQYRLQSFKNCSEMAVYNYAIDFAILYLQCLNEHLKTPMQLIEEFGEGVNQKSARFLKRLPPQPSSKCIWLSVGIDNDVGVETKFHDEHPDCEIIGIEVNPKRMENFRKIGGVGFAGALGLKEDVKVVRQHDIYKLQIDMYTVYEMSSFFDKHLHTRVLDYVFVDYRRMTFEILHSLFKGSQLEQEGIVFCQFVVNVPWKLGSTLNSDVVMHNLIVFLQEPDLLYIPITASINDHHFTITFVHLRHEKCRKIFDYGNSFG